MPDQNEPIIDQNSRDQMPPSMGEVPVHHAPNFWGRKITIVSLMVILMVGVGGLVWLMNSKAPATPQKKVALTIQGPKILAAGNEAEYIITYSNGENADLIGLSMEVFYPSNFKYSNSDPKPKTSSGGVYDLPVLRQGEQGEVVIFGKLTGRVGESKDIRVRLSYRQSNFNSEFQVEQNFSTEILAPNLTLEITGPVDVANGQDTTFTVNYANVAAQDFENVAVKVNYPAGFQFIQSNPAPTKDNNSWTIGKLGVGVNGKIDIKGSFTGDSNQEKLVTGELGLNISNNFAPQVLSSAIFKVISSSLTLLQTATPGEVTKLGDQINYKLKYANYGAIGMTNVVIALTLESPAIDFTQLRIPDAIIVGNTLTWKSATYKNLSLVSPNQEGEISFTLPLKETLSTNLKNQVIKGSAVIYSDQVTSQVRANDIAIKLSSELGLLVSGKYVSGAAPLQVGQPTTLSITFLLTNFSNDMTDVELNAAMPLPASAWKNVIIPDAEKDKLSFDANSSKIRWKVGNLPAFVGRFSEARTVTFQLEIVPNQGDKGSSILLLKDIMAEGQDLFTAQTLQSVQVDDYRTADLDDAIFEGSSGSVQ